MLLRNKFKNEINGEISGQTGRIGDTERPNRPTSIRRELLGEVSSLAVCHSSSESFGATEPYKKQFAGI